MVGLDSDREWEKFGKDEPYYGVVSLDRFHQDKLNPDALSQFFQSGEHHIRFILDTIRRRIDPEFRPLRALDFGCGVGRCLFPLARICDKAVGIDISKAMLQEAKGNAAQQKIENVELLPSDDELSALTGSFDLIHSFIVFQHIRPDRGEKLLARLAGLLSEKGVGVVQVIYDRDISTAKRFLGGLRGRCKPLHALANLATGQPIGKPLMEKNCYDLNRVLQIIRAAGARDVYAVFEGTGEIRSVIFFFRKDSNASVYDYEAFFESDAAGAGGSAL